MFTIFHVVNLYTLCSVASDILSELPTCRSAISDEDLAKMAEMFVKWREGSCFHYAGCLNIKIELNIENTIN